MPAAVESAAYANTPAWHKLGTVIDTNGKKGMTIEQALPASGLAWGVKKSLTLSFDLAHADLNDPAKLAKAMADGVQIPLSALMVNPGRYNTQRDTDGKLFGNVGETWVPFNPIDAFQIVDDLLTEAGGKAWIEACGALDGGKKVWVMVHLDTEFQIAGEKYATYLAVVTGFDGRTSTMVFVHTERIVCANTLAIGVKEGKDTGRIIRVRHTKNAADRIKEAKHILGVRDQQLEELAKQGEWLVNHDLDDAEFATFLDSLMPLPEDEGPAYTMRADRRGVISNLYFNAPNLEPIRNTRWGALQAVVEYADHKRAFADEETQMKAQIGFTAQNTELKDNAFKILKTDGLVLA